MERLQLPRLDAYRDSYYTTGFIKSETDDLASVLLSLESNSIGDIWVVGKSLIDRLLQKPSFANKDSGLSIVISQDYGATSYFGKICAVGTKRLYTSIMLNGVYGKYMLFQTR